MLKKMNKKNSIRKWITIIIVILLAIVVVYCIDLFKSEDTDNSSETKLGDTTFSYRDDFNTLNKDFWWVAKWVTLEDGSSGVEIENGIIKLPINETDRGPFLISKPIVVNKGDIVTIKRKTWLHYSNEYFRGNILITQSEYEDLNPLKNNNTWASVMYDTLARVDYYHYFYEPEKRDVTHGIVLFAKDEITGKSYSTIDPIFDEWFEEFLEYNTGTGQVIYKCNDQELKGTAKVVEQSYIRIILHGYGWFTGHEMKMDYFEVNVTH